MRQKKRKNYRVIVPEAVVQEVVDEPKEFAEKISETAPKLANRILDSVERVNAAIEQGLIEVQAVDYEVLKTY